MPSTFGPFHRSVEPSFQHLIRQIESRDLTYPIGIRLKSGLGNQANQLAISDLNPIPASELPDGGVDLPYRGNTIFRDIHTHLRPPVCNHSNGLNTLHATA